MCDEARYAPRRWVGLVAGLWMCAFFVGCAASNPLEKAGVSLRVPDGWTPVAATTWKVPGTPLAAWSGPGRSSLVIYRALPVPAGKGAALARGQANLLENLPGLRVDFEGVVTVAGRDAARVEVVAPGTGDALVPSGTGVPLAPAGTALIPTRRILVSVIRPGDTLAFVWHAPDGLANALVSQVNSTLKSVSIERGRLATSTY